MRLPGGRSSRRPAVPLLPTSTYRPWGDLRQGPGASPECPAVSPTGSRSRCANRPVAKTSRNGDLMRLLLSTIGSRGDVQPLVALALQLRALGQEVRLCAPPDFRDWIDGLGLPVAPIGPELRTLTAATPPATPAPLSPERRRQMMEGTVATQFETVAAAARGCDIIV